MPEGDFLPYGRQWVDEDDIQRVVDVLRGDYLTTGPAVAELEAALCGFSGCAHAVAVNSGTSALHCAYFAAGLGPGDELITTPMTFAATSNAALYLGADVTFVDVQPDTGNMDPAALREAISDRTKVVAPIDFTGLPADYDPIQEAAKSAGATLVADAAHSLGATYKGTAVGKLADLTEVSMHPVKPFTTGEGGAVLTDDPELAERAARFRTHGITRDPDRMTETDPGGWHYEMLDLGFNYRITDIQCALGLGQITRLAAFLARRGEIALRYAQAFADLDAIDLPPMPEDRNSGWHLYVLRIKEASRRRAFFDRLRELKIGVQVHYIPVHWHPYYQDLGFEKGQFPVAEDYFRRAVSIPIYPRMDDDDVDSAIERIRQAVKDVL